MRVSNSICPLISSLSLPLSLSSLLCAACIEEDLLLNLLSGPPRPPVSASAPPHPSVPDVGAAASRGLDASDGPRHADDCGTRTPGVSDAPHVLGAPDMTMTGVAESADPPVVPLRSSGRRRKSKSSKNGSERRSHASPSASGGYSSASASTSSAASGGSGAGAASRLGRGSRRGGADTAGAALPLPLPTAAAASTPSRRPRRPAVAHTYIPVPSAPRSARKSAAAAALFAPHSGPSPHAPDPTPHSPSPTPPPSASRAPRAKRVRAGGGGGGGGGGGVRAAEAGAEESDTPQRQRRRKSGRAVAFGDRSPTASRVGRRDRGQGQADGGSPKTAGGSKKERERRGEGEGAGAGRGRGRGERGNGQSGRPAAARSTSARASDDDLSTVGDDSRAGKPAKRRRHTRAGAYLRAGAVSVWRLSVRAGAVACGVPPLPSPLCSRNPSGAPRACGTASSRVLSYPFMTHRLLLFVSFSQTRSRRLPYALTVSIATCADCVLCACLYVRVFDKYARMHVRWIA